MQRDEKYQAILDEYPAVITKEQLYKICHISKRTAAYLLESGLIPCERSDKKTRKYKIATEDVVAFLEKRANAPGRFAAPQGWRKTGYGKGPREQSPDKLEKLLAYFESLMAPYPDVLSIDEVGELTGYSGSCISKWCAKDYLHHFHIGKKYLIPKPYLLDFMMGPYFRGIKYKPGKPSAPQSKETTSKRINSGSRR